MRIKPSTIIPRTKFGGPDEFRHAMFPKESRFQSAVEMWFKGAGWLCYHTWGSIHSVGGYPDLTCVLPAKGTVIWAELKTEKGRVSDEQNAWLKALSSIENAMVFLWRPSDEDEVMDVIRGSIQS